MNIRMTNYDLQFLQSIQTTSDSVFQEGNQCSVYAMCDIRETETDYVVSFRPPTKSADQINFDFLGSHLFITGDCYSDFSIDVLPDAGSVEAKYLEGIIQILFPKSVCKRLA